MLTFQQYALDAQRTESPVTPEVIARFESCLPNLFVFINGTRPSTIANTLKRYIYYGRGERPACNLVDLASRALMTHWWASQDLTNRTHIIRLFHGLLGIYSEAEELLDALVCNSIPHDAACYFEDADALDVVNINEECGDLLWYIALIGDVSSKLMDTGDNSMPEFARLNINKLKTRYPDKFTEDAAVNRDLNAERNALANHLEGSHDWCADRTCLRCPERYEQEQETPKKLWSPPPGPGVSKLWQPDQ